MTNNYFGYHKLYDFLIIQFLLLFDVHVIYFSIFIFIFLSFPFLFFFIIYLFKLRAYALLCLKVYGSPHLSKKPQVCHQPFKTLLWQQRKEGCQKILVFGISSKKNGPRENQIVPRLFYQSLNSPLRYLTSSRK